ncbi:MAG TPA: hypothetical protein ENK23_05365 [Sorangium sp.]|nr:hypothetical protein [Sorangium sp.]
MARADQDTAAAAPSASATAAPSASATAASKAADPAPVAVPPSLQILLDRAKDIWALIAGELDVAADPATLFEIDLNDEQAVRAEAQRLSFIIEGAKAAASDVADAGPTSDAGAKRVQPAANKRAGVKPGHGQSVDAGPADAAAPEEATDAEAPVDEQYWQARLSVDEARYAFLKLSAARRAGILAEHHRRQQAASDHDRQLAEAARKAREAAEERQRSLEAARRASSEGKRRVEREKARLLGLINSDSELNQVLLKEQEALATRADVRLAWERRVDELLAQLAAGSRDAQDVATIYAELTASLQQSSARLSAALNAFSNHLSRLQTIGDDPLSALDLKADLSDVKKLRHELEQQHAEIAALERNIVAQRAATLVREVRSLNEQRLRLLARLPDAQHEQLVGFGRTGRNQAKRELGKVLSVLRYHLAASVEWVRRFRWNGLGSKQRMNLVFQALKALALVMLYVWWYRRADSWLAAWGAREGSTAQGRPGSAAIAFLRRIRRPLEWLLLLLGLRVALPTDLAQLEFELITIISWWIFGESLVVNVIDALFARRRYRTARSAALSQLRLRSLHLVGRLVVVFGLTLSITVMLVGRGTIYTWAVRLGYFAVCPVVLLLIHWYRPHVLEHFNRRKEAGGVAGWIANHSNGWQSYATATIGAGVLTYHWAASRIENYAGRFDLVRRLLAYWFRREVSKHSDADDTHATAPLNPLPRKQLESLRPDRYASVPVPCEADKSLAELVRLVDQPNGGVYALIGERGSGKSTLLRRLADTPHATMVSCGRDGVAGLVRRIGAALELPEDTNGERLGKALAARGDKTVIVLDDAHHLIRPTIGGLDAFDTLLHIARQSSVGGCTWVVAIDSAIWNFLRGARGSKPMFDEIRSIPHWSEESISALLRRRCDDAAVEPNFDRLITELPGHADDIDRMEALARVETNYYRLLWDYSAGNPGIALHFWRQSLGIDDAGKHAVKLFAPPSLSDLEALPDSALFVLRAVLQVEQATVEDIVAATMLPAESVRDALRYALGRGYIEALGRYFRIEWGWLRAIASFLKRRHLLFDSGT